MKNVTQKLKLLPFMLMACILFSSCNDLLEENDGQLATGDLDFTKTEDMILPLVGAYAVTYSRGWEDPLLVGVRGDDVNAGGLGDQPLFAETDLFNYDNGFWMYNQVWENFYGDILDINNARETIEQYKEFATGENIALADQYIAETKVLSGFQHLQMSKLWGDIFIITSTNVEQELDNGVFTKEEVMLYISNLMDEAIPFLPDARPNERPSTPSGAKAIAKSEYDSAAADAWFW